MTSNHLLSVEAEAQVQDEVLGADTPLVQALMEAGFLAMGAVSSGAAQKIFLGVQAARPENELPIVGLAIAKLNLKAYDEAIQILKEIALKINPESEVARAFLGLSLKLAGHGNESDQVLQGVIKRNSDSQAVALAQSVLHPQD